eukprot:SAG31_NODE_31499_length_367_cov_1.145522_1_plen_38_part_01
MRQLVAKKPGGIQKSTELSDNIVVLAALFDDTLGATKE